MHSGTDKDIWIKRGAQNDDVFSSDAGWGRFERSICWCIGRRDRWNPWPSRVCVGSISFWADSSWVFRLISGFLSWVSPPLFKVLCSSIGGSGHWKLLGRAFRSQTCPLALGLCRRDWGEFAKLRNWCWSPFWDCEFKYYTISNNPPQFYTRQWSRIRWARGIVGRRQTFGKP